MPSQDEIHMFKQVYFTSQIYFYGLNGVWAHLFEGTRAWDYGSGGRGSLCTLQGESPTLPRFSGGEAWANGAGGGLRAWSVRRKSRRLRAGGFFFRMQVSLVFWNFWGTGVRPFGALQVGRCPSDRASGYSSLLSYGCCSAGSCTPEFVPIFGDHMLWVALVWFSAISIFEERTVSVSLSDSRVLTFSLYGGFYYSDS